MTKLIGFLLYQWMNQYPQYCTNTCLFFNGKYVFSAFRYIFKSRNSEKEIKKSSHYLGKKQFNHLIIYVTQFFFFLSMYFIDCMYLPSTFFVCVPFCFFPSGLHPWLMEVPSLGLKLEMWLPACTTARATPDPSLMWPAPQLMAMADP